MMKKITRIAALLATTALLLAGFPACGDDDGDEEPTLEKIEIGIAESVKLEYDINEEFDKTGITVTATYSDGSTKDVTDKATFTATTSEGEFTTATAGKHNVTLTATYEGKTDTATREITVKSDNPANDDKEDNSDGEDDGSDNNDSDNSGNEEGNESGNESGNENGNDNSGNSDSDTEEGNGNEENNGDEENKPGDDADDEQKILTVAYDLTGTLPTDISTSAEAKIATTWAAPTATPTENDVTWTWVATKNRKVKSNKGLQVSFGKEGAYADKSEEIIKLTADEPIVVTVTFDFTGKTYDTDNPESTSEDKLSYRGITVGDGSVVMSADLGVTKDDNTRSCKNSTAAKEVSIKANGIRITKIETAPAQ